MLKLFYIIFILCLFNLIFCQYNSEGVDHSVDSKLLKCLVCQSTIEEFDKEVSKLDPSKKVNVGNYRLDASGNIEHKQVSQSKSEVVLSGILDTICDKFNDYARAKRKTTGELILLKIVDNGVMNPQMSYVDIIQDGDLNKSLPYYCEEIVDEYEDSIIKNYAKGNDNVDIRVCSLEAHYCDHELPDNDESTIQDEL